MYTNINYNMLEKNESGYMIFAVARSYFEMMTVQLPQPPSPHAILVPVSVTAFQVTSRKMTLFSHIYYMLTT